MNHFGCHTKAGHAILHAPTPQIGEQGLYEISGLPHSQQALHKRCGPDQIAACSYYVSICGDIAQYRNLGKINGSV